MDNLVVDSMSVSNQAVHTGNIWFWIAIIEVFVILYLASRLIFHPQKGHMKVKEQLKSAPINLGNTINSAFNSKPLYDKLKVKCHPDRFANTLLQDKANELFQEIQANKNNYDKLKELEEKAIMVLNINF